MWLSKNLEWNDVLTLLFKGQGQILWFHVTNFSLKHFLRLCSVVPSCSRLVSKFPFLSHPRELLASMKFWCKDRAGDGGGTWLTALAWAPWAWSLFWCYPGAAPEFLVWSHSLPGFGTPSPLCISSHFVLSLLQHTKSFSCCGCCVVALLFSDWNLLPWGELFLTGWLFSV